MHFVSAESASRQAGITQTQLKELDDAGVVSGVEKNGCTFYSTCEVYRLKSIRFLMKTRGLTLDQARLQVDAPKHGTAAVATIS
jgi:MerR HTH family regulatory protein